MKRTALLLSLIGISLMSFSQFTLSGEFRPRTEYTHGFKSPATPAMEYGFFTSQRSRLNLSFKSDDFAAKISLQDIRVFGSTKQLNETDGFTSIHEAWAETKLVNKTFLRIGRQELVYDDARILGNVNWAQQARAHDLFLLKYENQFKIHVGAAFNRSEANLTSTFYNLTGNYKNMQFAWFHQEIKKLKYSILVLNNGMQYTDAMNVTSIFYSQTVGTHLAYALKESNLKGNFYIQTGKDASGNLLNAYNFLLEGKHQLTQKLALTAGLEFLSGGSKFNDEGALVNQAFNPFYGTNHAFNGSMDYFYVGNHLNSVGLLDIYLKTAYKLSEKLEMGIDAHYFGAGTEVINPLVNTVYSRNLGTEVDFQCSYKLNSISTLTAGYSQYFGTESSDVVKGGSYEEISNWAWIMFSFQPQFFKTN